MTDTLATRIVHRAARGAAGLIWAAADRVGAGADRAQALSYRLNDAGQAVVRGACDLTEGRGRR